MPLVTCIDPLIPSIIQYPTDVGAGSGWIKLKGIVDEYGNPLGYGGSAEAYALLLINKLYKFEYNIQITDGYGNSVEDWSGTFPMMQAYASAPDGGSGATMSTLGFVPADGNLYIDDQNMYVNCSEHWKDNGETDQVCKKISINGGIAWIAGNYGTSANGNVIYTKPENPPTPIPDNYFIDPKNIPHYTKNDNWDVIKLWSIHMPKYAEFCTFNTYIQIGTKDGKWYTKLGFDLLKSPVGKSVYAISTNPNFNTQGYAPFVGKIDNSSFQFKHNLNTLPIQIGIDYRYKTEDTDTSCFYFFGESNWRVSVDCKLSNVYQTIPDPNNGNKPMADPQLVWKYE